MRVTEKRSKGRIIILRGMGASRGKASGPVRIIHNIQDLEKMQLGDVLVTPMTNPDMVVAMTKAVAIVTDIGGITSHAAIISRELGIPCIVGTEVATKILKDVTLVEVDGTNGIVYECLERTTRLTSKKEFSIFGRKVTSVSLKMDREKPLWPDHWDFPWPEVDMNRIYEWIPYRPDIYGEPVANYLFSAIEKVPYALGFDVGPLYIRYHNCNLTLRLDEAQATLALLSDELISRDEDFFREWKKKLFDSYKRLDRVTEELEDEQNQFDKRSSSELVGLFKKWWRVHDDRFSLSFLIVSMGNIVWSEIRRILTELFDEESKVNEYLSLLALPTTKTTSIHFLDDCIDLINISKRVKSLILSNLDPKETLEIIGELKEGREWLGALEKFIDKWGWMRDRLHYHPPINSKERMIVFLKRHITTEIRPSTLEKNVAEFESCVQELSKLLPKERINDFMFYLDVGRFLQLERDSHHIRHMKQTNVVREIFLEFGRRLKEEGIFYDEKDIFFVFIQEVFKLLSSKTPTTQKVKIASKIANRMNAFTHVSGLKLHNRPGYDPERVPERDGEYY